MIVALIPSFQGHECKRSIRNWSKEAWAVSENPSRASVTSDSSSQRHGERLAVLWFVRTTLLLCRLISAEPWYGRQRRPTRLRARKSGAWALAFRSFFS